MLKRFALSWSHRWVDAVWRTPSRLLVAAIVIGATLAGAAPSQGSSPLPQLPNRGAGPLPAGGAVPARPSARGGCDTRYAKDAFRVCYYAGADPAAGTFLGAVTESSLGKPVADRAFGLDHDWSSEPVFGGIGPSTGQDVSGVWRGRVFFAGGRYQLVLFTSDGARLFVDDRLVIDEWQLGDERFGASLDLHRGYHRIRIEWFGSATTWWSTVLRLHWDRVPVAKHPQVSPAVIDVFLLRRQDACIAGDPWTSGDAVRVYNPDGSVYRAWQVDDVRGLPRSLVPSDPALSSYAQVECFSFGFRAEEVAPAVAQIDEFADMIESWTHGAIRPVVELHELQGSVPLSRWGTGWWVAPWELASVASPLMTKASDFAVAVTSIHDLDSGRYIDIGGCGGTFGVDYGIAGTGYSWVPHTQNPGFWFECLRPLTLLHEWEHQLTFAVNELMGLPRLYPDLSRYPATGYPPCGQGDPDTFKWFPDSHDWGTDPDSPWCGPTAIAGISELHVLAHFDASLSHYVLGRLTGNHCDDEKQDFGETGVDTGGNCPGSQSRKSARPRAGETVPG